MFGNVSHVMNKLERNVQHSCSHTCTNAPTHTHARAHTPTHVRTHTHIHGGKMADDVSQQIESALNTIINLTEKIGNLKKELKHSIHESVTTLRKLVFTLKSDLLIKTEEINKTRNEGKQLKDCSEKLKSTTSVRQVTPSFTCFTELTSQGTAISSPPSGSKKKLFSDVLSRKNTEWHRLRVKPNDNKTAEEIKNLLRTKLDPVNMKIGIRTFKSLRNENVLIEADSK